MSLDSVSVRVFACLSLLLCGCGREALAIQGACDGVAPGQLVITEVHANPDGADGDAEYVELYNGSGVSQSLDAFTLESARADGAGQKSHRLAGVFVEAGDYVVLGNAPFDSLPAHVDFSYGAALGSLRNSDASISLRCGETLVDRVAYERTSDGRALELDGGLAPDHRANDDPSAWCASAGAADALATGGLGTPGRRNSPCDEGEPADGCVQDGTRRELVTPATGDVRIEEWMANPEGLDADLEWVEVYFPRVVDLNGLQLGPAPEELSLVVESDDCFPVDAGARVVFGASPAAAPRVDAELPFSLRNSGEHSIVAAVGGVVLDRVDYLDAVEGVSWQRDDAGEVCLAASVSTPGEPNPSCAPVLAEGQCLDGGVPRDIVRPRAGRARISEWLASPNAVDDRVGEWVELRFDDAVDLNGLTLSDRSASSPSFEGTTCHSVAAGAHIVWARELGPELNGGIGLAAAELGISLNNRDEDIVLSVDGEVLDAVSYARSEPGVAVQVDSSGLRCAATLEYGDGDFGTPGLPNPACD